MHFLSNAFHKSIHADVKICTCKSSSVKFTQASSDVKPKSKSRLPKSANSAPGPGTIGISPEEEAVG